MTKPHLNFKEREQLAAARGNIGVDGRPDNVTENPEAGYTPDTTIAEACPGLLGFPYPAVFDPNAFAPLNPRNPRTSEAGIPPSAFPGTIVGRWIREALDGSHDHPAMNGPARNAFAALGKAAADLYTSWANLQEASAGLNLGSSEDTLAQAHAVQRVDTRISKTLNAAHKAAGEVNLGILNKIDAALVPEKKHDQTASAEIRAHFKQGMKGGTGEAANTLAFLMKDADKATIYCITQMPPYLSGLTDDQVAQLKSYATKRFAPDLLHAHAAVNQCMSDFLKADQAWRSWADKRLAALKQPRSIAAAKIHAVK